MRQIRSGGLSLLENYQNDDKIMPASPMSEYINTLKVQYSKETMKWMQEEERKKLALSKQKIK